MLQLILRTGAIGLCLAIALLVFGEPQQPASHHKKGEVLAEVSSEDYERVLGLVFSPTTQAPRDLVFSIVLRFRPSFEPESEVIIRQGRGQAATVEYIAAEHNVHTTLNGLLRVTPGVRPEALARDVHVQRRTINLPAGRPFALQAALFASLNETLSALRAAGATVHGTGETTVTLDGESYELWYEQGLTRFSGFFSASEADLSATPNAIGIGKWARALRDEIVHAAEVNKDR
jgi:hypothetical protein